MTVTVIIDVVKENVVKENGLVLDRCRFRLFPIILHMFSICMRDLYLCTFLHAVLICTWAQTESWKLNGWSLNCCLFGLINLLWFHFMFNFIQLYYILLVQETGFHCSQEILTFFASSTLPASWFSFPSIFSLYPPHCPQILSVGCVV